MPFHVRIIDLQYQEIMKLRQGTFNAAGFKIKTNAPFIDEMLHHSIANDEENSDFIISTVLGINPEMGKGTNVNDEANNQYSSLFKGYSSPLEYFSQTYNRDKELFENKRWVFDPNDRRSVAIHYNLIRFDTIRAEALRGEVKLATDVMTDTDRTMTNEQIQ